MTLTSTSTLPEVAAAVGAHLREIGIEAVLTGGACVSVYTDGSYVSKDADFVVRGRVRQLALDTALAELGFKRDRDRYVHADLRFYLEFPPGPLAIGADLTIQPVEVAVGDNRMLALSATDSCRDRLAAFYHWHDRQSLRLAVAIARDQEVDFKRIREWSLEEQSLAGYEEFIREVGRSQR